MVEDKLPENDDNRLMVAKEIVKILPHQPFYIMGANTSKVSVEIFKNIKVVALADAPSNIVPVREQVPVDPVSAELIYKGKQNRKRHFGQRQKGTKTDTENRKDD